MEQVVRPRAQAYSSSDPPPVAPRRDLQNLALRRIQSSGTEHAAEQSRKTAEKPYESEYDKLNRILRTSLKAKPVTQQHDAEYAIVKHRGKKSNGTETSRGRSKTQLSLQPSVAEDEDLYLAAEDIASLPRSRKLRQTLSTSPIAATKKSEFNYPCEVSSTSLTNYSQPETAIYGVAQGIGENFVMELKELQRSANNLYRKLLSANSTSPEMADLRTHLRTGDQAPTTEILVHIYQTLQPPTLPSIPQDDYGGIYLVDFRDCREKAILREKLHQLFATPGPPSVTYQKVTAKLDAVIREFVETIIKMRKMKNETLVSPYHAQTILQHNGQEGEHLVRVLQTNELWIQWGTETGLPPLPHIYLLKHPPTYEMRKAIVLSMIADKKDFQSSLPKSQWRSEIFIPPIYSKLDSEDDSWQMTEYDPDTRTFETTVVPFPKWVEECPKLASHLKSSNRTSFQAGDHIYALFSVYLIVIKDITMKTRTFAKESRMPCDHQIFIGSSSTGVLFRFLTVQNNHCDRIKNILELGESMSSFRCQQDIALEEACLALSWIRRQPRAVFVINSFQEGDMTNLSLKKKKPFHEKMLALEQHYIHSRKLGPTNDMRYGMNRLGDKVSP